MQDRLKYRHFNKLVKKMTYYDKPEMQVCINGDFKSGLIFPMSEDIEDNAIYMGSYHELQQCIGRRDKNEKLIYEGDIVRQRIKKDVYLYSRVFWDERDAAFYLSDENGLHKIPSKAEKLEIIGNIFENAELLKQHAM